MSVDTATVGDRSLAEAPYSEYTRSLVHSLLCPKLERLVLLLSVATWRQGSRRPLCTKKGKRVSNKYSKSGWECAVAIVVAKLR